MWSFYGIFPYRRNTRKYLFAFYKAVFCLSLPLLHEILFPARIWQAIVNLCYATFLDSLLGKQEYCQQFRSILRNIRTCWVRQSKLLYITKLVQNGVPTMPSCLWLNHCTIQLCVCSGGCMGEPGTHNPPTPPSKFIHFHAAFDNFFAK